MHMHVNMCIVWLLPNYHADVANSLRETLQVNIKQQASLIINDEGGLLLSSNFTGHSLLYCYSIPAVRCSSGHSTVR
jgi:hypothetical protein